MSFQAGCTVMKRALGLSYGKINTTQAVTVQTRGLPGFQPGPIVHSPRYYDILGLKQSDQLPPEDYMKILVVRNPYTRLLSAYKDKVLYARGTYKKWSEQIGAKYRPLNSNITGPTTFSEFAKWIGSHFPLQPLDVHFANLYSFCAPCLIKYDYMIKQETIEEDAEYIFKHVMRSKYNLNELLSAEVGPHDTHKSNVTKTQAEYYAELHSKERETIQRFLQPDAQLFGYDTSYPTTYL